MSYLFRYKFVPGKEIRYRIDITGSLDFVAPGEKMKNPINMEMVIGQHIVSCDEKEAIIKVQIEEVKAAPNMPQDKLPEVGSNSVMKMDVLGNTSWVNGKAAWEGAEHSLMVFPEQELQPGDSWVRQTEDASGTAGVFFTKYRLNGFDRKFKHLTNFTTELFSGNPEEAGSISIGKGVFSFNSEDGWIENSGTFIKHESIIPVPDMPNMKIRTITSLNIQMERI